MRGGIGVDRTAPTPSREADRAQALRQFLRGLAVLDMEIQVELLWVRGVRPAWWLELRRMLERQHRGAAVVAGDHDA
ncbi:MAG TPA: hypothetical protein DIU14_03655, partial [Actinobacteria bacterium]|nr:hypothetical protein [Actinomycetota bacterium]